MQQANISKWSDKPEFLIRFLGIVFIFFMDLQLR